jgi:predicted ArsR family transcriptional regulator
VTARERLHQLVDELSDQEADDALRYIVQRREDPMIAAFRDAPEDDEPFTAADEDALAEVQADRSAGVRGSPTRRSCAGTAIRDQRAVGC